MEQPLNRSERLPCDMQRDRRCWTSSIAIGVGFTVVAMAFSLLALPAFAGVHAWIVPGDIWMVTGAALHVWNGALGYVYEVNSNWYSLPLSAILLAPVVGLSDHLHLVGGTPFPIAHPTSWLLIGPYSLLYGIFLLHAVRRLAWEVGVHRRLWAVQALSVLLVLFPAAQWSHFEDVIALTFVVHATRRVLAGDTSRAALYLAVAIASKQWAMLLVPAVVWAAPVGRRLTTLLLAASLPGALALFTLGVDWRHASHALLFPSVVYSGNPGHLAFFAHWLGSRTSRPARMLALAASPAIAWRTRQWRTPAQLLGALAAVMVVRALLEPVNFSYYWSPALIAAGLSGAAARRRVRWQDWLWPTLAMVWTYPATTSQTWMRLIFPTVTNSAMWWAGEALLLVAASIAVGGACGLRLPGRGYPVAGLAAVSERADLACSPSLSSRAPSGALPSARS